MNTSIRSACSRLGRIAVSTLTALSLLTNTCPAFAVTDPGEGKLRISLYQDSGCEGASVLTEVSAPASSSGWGVADLGSMNNKASSWSACNDTGATLYVTLHLWTGTSYTGTEITPITRAAVPTGTCVVGNHISPNDSVRSFGCVIYTTAQ